MGESRLEAIRSDPGRRRIAIIAGAALGVALASLHWIGMVVAGALVGVFAPSLRRGLLWGLGVGVVIVGVFLVQATVSGTIDRVIRAGRPILVAVGIPLVLTPLGALVRALD